MKDISYSDARRFLDRLEQAIARGELLDDVLKRNGGGLFERLRSIGGTAGR